MNALEPDEDGLERLRIDIWRARVGRRLDKYISGRIGKRASRTSLQGYIRDGKVTVNGQVVKPSYAIRAGDTIEMLLPSAKPREIPPEPIGLNVVYEDDDVLAVNKQAGLIVHPARGNWTGTLVNALAYYFKMNWRDTGATHQWRCSARDRPQARQGHHGLMLVADRACVVAGNAIEHRRYRSLLAIVSGLLAVDW